jgi:uridine phosphorylase
MSTEHWWNTDGKTKVFKSKTYPSATSFTTNLSRTGLGLNLVSTLIGWCLTAIAVEELTIAIKSLLSVNLVAGNFYVQSTPDIAPLFVYYN